MPKSWEYFQSRPCVIKHGGHRQARIKRLCFESTLQRYLKKRKVLLPLEISDTCLIAKYFWELAWENNEGSEDSNYDLEVHINCLHKFYLPVTSSQGLVWRKFAATSTTSTNRETLPGESQNCSCRQEKNFPIPWHFENTRSFHNPYTCLYTKDTPAFPDGNVEISRLILDTTWIVDRATTDVVKCVKGYNSAPEISVK